MDPIIQRDTLRRDGVALLKAISYALLAAFFCGLIGVLVGLPHKGRGSIIFVTFWPFMICFGFCASRFVTRKTVIAGAILFIGLALGIKMEYDWCKSIHEDTLTEFIKGTLSNALPVIAVMSVGIFINLTYILIQKVAAKIETIIKRFNSKETGRGD